MVDLMSVGYEGPATIGDVVGAVAIFVCCVVLVLFVIRWLVTFLSDERKPVPPAPVGDPEGPASPRS